MAQAVTPIRPTDTLMSRETAGDRVRRLEADARAIAAEERAALLADLCDNAGRCVELAGMVSLPPGQRDVLRRLAETIEASLTTIQAIGGRVS